MFSINNFKKIKKIYMAVDWLQISRTGGTGDYDVTITASTNEELLQRLAYIMAYNNEEGLSDTLEIIQEAAPAIITGMSFTYLNWVTDISSDGGTATKSNCSYAITGYLSDGTTNDITSLCDVNGSQNVPSSTLETRHSAGTLTLTATYNSLSSSSSTTIYQEAFVPYLNALPVAITFGPSGGSATIHVSSNVCSDVSVSGSTPPPPPPPPIQNNQIYYTSTDGNILAPHSPTAFNVSIVSNTYEEGQGIITFDGPLTSIGYEAFKNCGGLSSIVLPTTLTEIGKYAFQSCSSLTGITIPNSVTTIGNYAFEHCDNMTADVVIPSSVTNMGGWIFNSCGFANCTFISATPPAMGSDLFFKTPLVNIYVPAESVELYKATEGLKYETGKIKPIP